MTLFCFSFIIALLSAIISTVCYQIRDKSPLPAGQDVIIVNGMECCKRNAVFNQSTLLVLITKGNKEQ